MGNVGSGRWGRSREAETANPKPCNSFMFLFLILIERFGFDMEEPG
jgi:hypothetical protein